MLVTRSAIANSLPARCATAGALLALGCGSLGAAEGSRLVGTGPTQLATAGAGVASPQDSTWLSLNAAGLTEVGHRIDGSAELIYAEVELDSKGSLGNPVGKQDDAVFVVAPHLTYARPVADGRGAFGVGFYSVSGLAVGWDEPRSIMGTADDFDKNSELTNSRLSAAYAHRVGEATSVGVALNLNYAVLSSDIVTAAGVQTAGANEEDEALGAGFQLALLHRSGDLQVGLSYTSRQWMQPFEAYDDVLIGPLDQPQVIQMGIAWDAAERWEVLADFRFIDWSSVSSVADSDQGFGWSSQNVLKLAARYRPSDPLALTAGISYGASPIGEEDVFVNGLAVLISEWHLSAGATFRVAERWELQSSLMVALPKELTDDGTKLGGGGAGTTISLSVLSLGLGLGYLF